MRYPAVAPLTNDLVGYILTEEEYRRGGYETTTSFYGPTLGPLLTAEAESLARSLDTA